MIDWILEGLADVLITVINYVILAIGTALGWLIALLPESPFQTPTAPPESVNLGWISWLIPFTEMFADTVLLTGAILIYYGYRVIGRWFKLVKG